MTNKVLRWKRFWLPTRVTVYLHRTCRHQVTCGCVWSHERFLKWIFILCVEAGSHYELTGSEQNRRGWVQSVLTLLKWLQKHVQYFQTQETLRPCVSYTSPSLWDYFLSTAHPPYSYARARLFGSDSSSKLTKDIYVSGVPKYKYKAFNSSTALCFSRQETYLTQPLIQRARLSLHSSLCLSGFIKPQQNLPIRTLPQLLCVLKSSNSFKLHSRRDSEGFQWETFNWNIELKQIKSTLLDTSSP